MSWKIMNEIRANRRGQFVILAAIVVAAFMFTLVISINQLSTMRQEVPYEPLDELVLAITSDFERCLTRALAIATQKYSESWDLDSAKGAGEELIDVWRQAIPESYSGLGTNIVLNVREGYGRSVGWDISWDGERGVSMIYTTFTMDVEAYGLKGLAVTMQKIVELSILDARMEFSDTGNKIIITFQTYLSDGRKYMKPVSDLVPNSLKLLINGTEYENYDITSFEYLGMGNYSATFDLKERVIANNITLIASIDGVRVAATKRLCILTLQSDDPSKQGTENEGTFDIEINEFREKERSPPYTISLFPGQTIRITFNLEGVEFHGFSSSGPVSLIENGTTALVIVTSYGQANVTAIYGTVSLSSTATLSLSSREDGGGTVNLGSIKLKFLNGTEEVLDQLPWSIDVPCNESITIEYKPDFGYVFKYWEASHTIMVKRTPSGEYVINVLGNGSLVAVYEASRPKEWQTLFIYPAKGDGRNKDKEFTLELYYPQKDDQISPPLNKKFDERSGNTTKVTPTPLRLGENITITLYAKYTKKSGKESIDVKVILGFFASNGTFFEIGNDTRQIEPSSSYEEYRITFRPSVDVIPEGSIITLTFIRMDDGEGTLHIECGPYKSSIKLW
ncbi:MAG: hypothetical protein QXI35_08085 [Candidatus Nezhaarchaeales archaeon]